MRAAVTGHTKGIGQALYDFFSKEYKVCGFSRSNGYDICRPDDRKKIINEIKDVDIFVNNAYNDFDDSQLLLLKEIVEEWKDKKKIIINVSSRYVGDFDIYAQSKLRLDQFCKTLIYHPTLFVLNLKPGLTDTERVKSLSGDRLVVQDVVSVVKFCLDNLDNFKVHEISFGK